MTERPRRIDLPSEEVHVWHASLDVEETCWGVLAASLSPEESERAGRFRFEQHRRWFVAGRGLLRRLLGAYLGVEPGGIRLAYGEHGKPRLADDASNATLAFNVSHSHAHVAYAVTRGREIGIDIERFRPFESALAVAAHHFSARENSILAGLSDENRQKAFFRAWVRKEAWLKAVGSGLSFPLDQVEVAVNEDACDDGASPLLGIGGDPSEAAKWSMRDLPLIPDHAAALAVRGRISACPCRQWSGDGS